MSGALPRTVCTAALVTVTVMAAVPGSAGTAPAAAHGLALAPVGRMAALLDREDTAAESGAAPSVPHGTGPYGTGGALGTGTGATVVEALTRLRTLYRQAEDAGETHLAAERRLTAQRAETARLGRELTRARGALDESRAAAGQLAREQYRGHSELSSLLRLLLSPDPRRALDEGRLMERAAAHRLSTTARLKKDTHHATDLARASRKALDRERSLAAGQRRARDAATERLKAVEELLASLTPAQIAALTSPGVRDSVIAHGAPAGERTPTAQGATALRYAVEQIGKPYLWGAEGPGSYDCSGLTSQAWAAAGRAIPRTSQEQWAQLPRVPLRSLRPGDLVVYFPGATHVAIYLGGGMVVQAPRPGTTVKVSPIAANPLLGAVRPDPESSPLRADGYIPPQLPEGATAGSDAGWSRAAEPGDQEAGESSEGPDAALTSAR
ncbi:C40 family peptidase [Streptomyces katsurahamanus]|nr:C40 family peptidase [Streptomyces katsurahamanus]